MTPANELTPVIMLIVASEDMKKTAKGKLCPVDIHRSMRYRRRSELENCQKRHFPRKLSGERVNQDLGFFYEIPFFPLIHHFKQFLTHSINFKPKYRKRLLSVNSFGARGEYS